MNTEIPNEPITDAVFTQQPATSKTSNNDLITSTVSTASLTDWQPTGYRIVVKIPYVGDDKTPLVGFRVTPRIPMQCYDPHITYTTQPIHNNDWIYPLPSESRIAPSTSTSPIEITRVDAPGPLARLASCYRYYTGSLMFRFRAVSNFLAQGYMIAGVIHGTSAEMVKNTSTTVQTVTLQKALRRINGVGDGYGQFMLNSYQMSDLSEFRHIEVTVPYEGFTSWYDMEYYDASWVSTQPLVNLQTESFVILAARGAITSTGGSSATLAYEIEMAAGPDFQLAGPIMCPQRSTYISPTLPFSYPNGSATLKALTRKKKKDKPNNVQSDEPLVEELSNIALSPLHTDEQTPAMNN